VRYAVFILIFLSLVLASCAFRKPLPSAHYGEPPTEFARQIPEYMDKYLRDPFTAQYLYIGSPIKGYSNDSFLDGGKVIWHGWVVPFQVNAKNPFNGDTGYKPYVALYENQSLWKIKAGRLEDMKMITLVE